MLKKWSLLFTLILSACIVVACNEEEPVEEQEVEEEIHTLNLEKARQTTDQLYEDVMSTMTAYFEENNITSEIATPEQIDALLSELEPYATEASIEDELRSIAQVYCLGCDAYLFSYFFESSSFVRGEVEQVSPTEITMTNYSHPDIAFGGSPMKATITLAYVDDTWKLAGAEREEVVLNLTEEEALIVAQNYSLEDPEVIEIDTNAAGTQIYVISSASGTIRINADTGMEEFEEMPPNLIEEPVIVEEEFVAVGTPKGQVVDLQKAFDAAVEEESAIYESSDDYSMFVTLDEKAMDVWDAYIANVIETVTETMPNRADEVEADYATYIEGFDAAVYEESGGSGLYNSGMTSAMVYIKRSFSEELLQKYK